MGKIRVKTFGDEEQEQKEKEKFEQKRQARLQTLERSNSGQAKKAEKSSPAKASANAKATADRSEGQETAAPDAVENIETEKVSEEKKPEKTKSAYSKKAKAEKKAFHSQKYQSLLSLVDRTKKYTLSEALELLAKLQREKFDETVELHLNTNSSGISGNITLPHGTGKKTKVAIATDALIAEIEKGIISFDILVAASEMMPKLGRVAKILGPRGLMPNPKNGTITEKPEEVAKKYEGGQVNFKTEAKTPIIHLTVGKMSFGAKKLSENIESLISAIKKANITNATLKSTMSPGIKLKI